MDLLRFAAIGSVDDGKSTLIGRLLADTKQLFDDQIDAIARASQARGHLGVDLSFATDGLRAEREQGITIDVAYRYAATPRRKFVIADCPGHLQYTSNMATGASTAEAALMVVDARLGVRSQSRRHLCIAALLGVSHLVLAVNKMDLVGWDPEVFRAVSEEVGGLAGSLGIDSVVAVPVSALYGDNVVVASGESQGFYRGPTVLGALEAAPAAPPSCSGARLPVQWVLRHPQRGRGYAGMFSGAPLRPGDEVVVLPGGHPTRVVSVENFDGPLEAALSGMSVTVWLADDLDVARGDMIASADDPVPSASDIEAVLCWFGERPLEPGDRYRIKHTTRSTPAMVREVCQRLDVEAMTLQATSGLSANDIGTVRICTASPLVLDSYLDNRSTGSFILIDEQTKATVAAGMVGVEDRLRLRVARA